MTREDQLIGEKEIKTTNGNYYFPKHNSEYPIDKSTNPIEKRAFLVSVRGSIIV